MFKCDAEDIGAVVDCPKCGSQFRIAADVSAAHATRPSDIECYLGIFGRYFGFRGRMTRRAFWWAFLFQVLASVVVAVIDDRVFDEYDRNRFLLIELFGCVTAIPFFAAHARRLHDTGKSAWWIPLIVLPPINVAYFVWLATAGDQGRNRFGPEPKGR